MLYLVGQPYTFLHDVLSGGITTIPLLLASLNKLLSARWWTPVQRMKHQWRYSSLGKCSSEAMCTPKGASLICIRECCRVFAPQSDSSLSGSKLNSQKAVGVVVGLTCSKHTPGDCLYGFSQQKPVGSWRFDYLIPPLANVGTGSIFLMAVSALSSQVHITWQPDWGSFAGIMRVIHLWPLTNSISTVRVFFNSFTLDIDGHYPST